MGRQIVFQYLLSLVLFAAGLIVFVLLTELILRSFIWQISPVYAALKWIEEHLFFLLIAVFLLGWVGLTYYFITKPLRYLEEITDASKKLADPGKEPIVLSEPLKPVQDELNLFREQAFQNALAAKEAEQRKNDLIVYLAHDLKTPLTSIIGYLSLLQDEPQISPELRAKYTGIALDKALRLEDLINEFFDITRFSFTTQVLEPERTNLTRMLQQITSEFQPVLAEKNLTWRTEIQGGVEILCDRNKMGRVFDNLVRNAINYSYEGTEIFLSMEQLGELVNIRVENRGKTIPREKLEHLFEQFFRVDSSRSTVTGAAGLGLAIAKEIVEQHGGLIEAKSANESIVFLVHLPVDYQKHLSQ
ncbi:MAG: HAMP domain-containing histidine kinase [Firmicutes bacterium]|nr:HAMP domain-containing histidine kinase [Bacillota bacterium]